MLFHRSMRWPNYGNLLLVSSLLGVVLIARPEFLFGRHQESGEVHSSDDGSGMRTVTAAQRLIAVGYVNHETLDNELTRWSGYTFIAWLYWAWWG